MNAKRLLSSATVALLSATGPVLAGLPPIDVHSTASVSPATVILDIAADTNGNSLRGFGLTVRYKPDDLQLRSAGTYDGLWFLRGENGVTYPYTDATTPESGSVRLVGGCLDGLRPDRGVSGQSVLLATLVFERLNANVPAFELDFAGPAPFSSFVSEGGDELDPVVVFHVPTQQPMPIDSDNDGLPDGYETDTFGDLVTSNGATDTDHDGDSDLDEFIKGTDPTDPLSRCLLRIVVQTDGSKLLVWDSTSGRVHNLLWSTDGTSFELLVGGLPGGASELQAIDGVHSADSRGFYEVMTEFPTAGR